MSSIQCYSFDEHSVLVDPLISTKHSTCYQHPPTKLFIKCQTSVISISITLVIQYYSICIIVEYSNTIIGIIIIIIQYNLPIHYSWVRRTNDCQMECWPQTYIHIHYTQIECISISLFYRIYMDIPSLLISFIYANVLRVIILVY